MADPFTNIKAETPSGVHAQAEQQARWVMAYTNDIVLQDVTVVDRHQPAVVTGMVDETGEELTYERRLQLAQRRRLEEEGDYRTSRYDDLAGEPDLRGDVAVRFQHPCIRIIKAREMEEEAAKSAAEEMDEALAACETERRMNGESDG